MKSRFVFILLFFVFLVSGGELFAFGKKQIEEEKIPQQTNWVFCITAFDTSSLSPVWQSAGDTVTRSFAGTLQGMTLRFRGEEEAEYLRNYTWAKSKTTAADALAKKRNERDLLIFRGDPEWKYRKNLKAAEDAIVQLEEALALIEAPLIEDKPVFKLTEQNKTGVFPLPPEPGRENSFCFEQKANAFLAGSLVEYYGRIYLNIKMYTRHTSSYSFEDSLLFSYEDFDKAVEEIGNRLAEAVTESLPSAVLVHATPPEAMVLVDNMYAGQGKTEVYKRSPGTADIVVRASSHLPLSYPLELNSGELSELFISLTSLGRTIFDVEKTEAPGSKVYLGSLYMGVTPLTLELPRDEHSYISVETPGGEVGSVIYRDNAIAKSTTQFVRLGDDHGTADFITALPVSLKEQKVETARNNFYKYYGAFWFILPAALLTAGIASTYTDANDYVNANQYGVDPATREKIRASAGRANLASTAAYGIMAAALGVSIYQIFRYVIASGKESTPILKAEPKDEEEGEN